MLSVNLSPVAHVMEVHPALFQIEFIENSVVADAELAFGPTT